MLRLLTRFVSKICALVSSDEEDSKSQTHIIVDESSLVNSWHVEQDTQADRIITDTIPPLDSYFGSDANLLIENESISTLSNDSYNNNNNDTYDSFAILPPITESFNRDCCINEFIGADSEPIYFVSYNNTDNDCDVCDPLAVPTIYESSNMIIEQYNNDNAITETSPDSASCTTTNTVTINDTNECCVVVNNEHVKDESMDNNNDENKSIELDDSFIVCAVSGSRNIIDALQNSVFNSQFKDDVNFSQALITEEFVIDSLPIPVEQDASSNSRVVGIIDEFCCVDSISYTPVDIIDDTIVISDQIEIESNNIASHDVSVNDNVCDSLVVLGVETETFVNSSSISSVLSDMNNATDTIVVDAGLACTNEHVPSSCSIDVSLETENSKVGVVGECGNIIRHSNSDSFKSNLTDVISQMQTIEPKSEEIMKVELDLKSKAEFESKEEMKYQDDEDYNSIVIDESVAILGERDNVKVHLAMFRGEYVVIEVTNPTFVASLKQEAFIIRLFTFFLC